MTESASLDERRSAAQADVRDLRGTLNTLDAAQIDLILTKARSHYAWKDQPVSDAMLRDIYDIMKMGPTSMNTCPARITYVLRCW